jgi:effector-binding domain-containing protein
MAAVRVKTLITEIAKVWQPALDQAWTYARAHPELSPGHNVFLYHHPATRSDLMDIDFGVAVARPFTDEGNVKSTATPAGEVATTLHIGPYPGLHAAHNAIHAWCAANSRQIGGMSWEIYGDWNNDHSKLETRVVYLLK